MKIYKSEDLQKLATQMVIQDIQNDPRLILTNASYSQCSYCSCHYEYWNKKAKQRQEKHIYYSLKHNYRTKCEELVRTIELKNIDSVVGEKVEKQVILELFEISYYDYVYCDNREFAQECINKRHKREMAREIIEKDTYTLTPHTKTYDMVFTKVCNYTMKNLKYGSKLQVISYVSIDYYNHKYKKFFIKYEYRKQVHSIQLKTEIHY